MTQYREIEKNYGQFSFKFRDYLQRALNQAAKVFEHIGMKKGRQVGIEKEPYWAGLDSEGFGEIFLG